MTTTRITRVTLLVLLALGIVLPGHALAEPDSTALALAGLAENARTRASTIERDLTSLEASRPGMDPQSYATQYARLTDLKERNERVLAGYTSRLGGPSDAPAAPQSTGPAAPESSGGGMFSGIGSKISGLFGGGNASNPAGPVAQSFGGASGQGFDIKSYLKENWPTLVGNLAGTIVGGILVKRFLPGSGRLGSIAGTIVGGYIGGKLAQWAHGKFKNKLPAALGGPGGGASYGGERDPVQAYAPPRNNGVQITYPAGYQGAQAQTAAPARSLAEAREMMTGRYQAFLASSQNPQMQAAAYQNYMQSKTQYEQLLAQAQGR